MMKGGPLRPSQYITIITIGTYLCRVILLREEKFPVYIYRSHDTKFLGEKSTRKPTQAWVRKISIRKNLAVFFLVPLTYINDKI
jgi:hypothetical protein